MIRDEEMNSFETKEDLVNNAKFWIGVSYNEISKYSEEIRQYKQKLAEAETDYKAAMQNIFNAYMKNCADFFNKGIKSIFQEK